VPLVPLFGALPGVGFPVLRPFPWVAEEMGFFPCVVASAEGPPECAAGLPLAGGDEVPATPALVDAQVGEGVVSEVVDGAAASPAPWVPVCAGSPAALEGQGAAVHVGLGLTNSLEDVAAGDWDSEAPLLPPSGGVAVEVALVAVDPVVGPVVDPVVGYDEAEGGQVLHVGMPIVGSEGEAWPSPLVGEEGELPSLAGDEGVSSLAGGDGELSVDGGRVCVVSAGGGLCDSGGVVDFSGVLASAVGDVLCSSVGVVLELSGGADSLDVAVAVVGQLGDGLSPPGSVGGQVGGS
jgi:hypothetical protein